jgi:hypothetical protein
MLGIEYRWGRDIALTDLRMQEQGVQTTLRYDLSP